MFFGEEEQEMLCAFYCHDHFVHPHVITRGRGGTMTPSIIISQIVTKLKDARRLFISRLSLSNIIQRNFKFDWNNME